MGALALVAASCSGRHQRPRRWKAVSSRSTGMARAPTIAPDGHTVTYVSGQRSVVVQSIDGGEPWAVNASARYVDGPRWTHDGRAVVFIGMQDSLHLAATYAAPREGGAVTRALEDQVPLDTGPDSTIARMPRERPRIQVLDWRTGAALRTVALPDSLQSQGIESVVWSPDQTVFAFEARGAIWTIPVGGGTATRIATGRWPRWAESSRAVYFLNGAPGSEALTGSPSPGALVCPRVRSFGSPPCLVQWTSTYAGACWHTRSRARAHRYVRCASVAVVQS